MRTANCEYRTITAAINQKTTQIRFILFSQFYVLLSISRSNNIECDTHTAQSDMCRTNHTFGNIERSRYICDETVQRLLGLNMYFAQSIHCNNNNSRDRWILAKCAPDPMLPISTAAAAAAGVWHRENVIRNQMISALSTRSTRSNRERENVKMTANFYRFNGHQLA